MDLLVATHNQGKLAEYADLLGEADVTLLTLDMAGISEEVAETGETFLANAVLKAQGYARQTGLLTLADDSGLEVDAMGGRPGVHTARYGGDDLSPVERYLRLLVELDGVPDEERSARFRCVIVLAGGDGSVLGTAEGTLEGAIATTARGGGGFGYDPVFWLPGRQKTLAQLSPAEKHAVSHRGQALRAIAPLLRSTLEGG